MAAVAFDDPAGDGEAQPRAAAVAPARRVRAVEAVEDAGDVLAADADAGILHLDGGPAVLRATGAQADDAAGGGVLGGVVAQDAAALLEHIAVGKGGDVFLGLDAPVVVTVDELGILVDFLDQFGDVQQLHIQPAAAHVAPGEEEQLIDELFHVLALGLDGGDALIKHLFVALAPAVEHGGVALNDGDGRAQFVRGVGDELPLPLVGFVQARKQAVDGLFEAAQVAVAGAQRLLRAHGLDAVLEVVQALVVQGRVFKGLLALEQGAGGAGHLVQRTQKAARAAAAEEQLARKRQKLKDQQRKGGGQGGIKKRLRGHGVHLALRAVEDIDRVPHALEKTALRAHLHRALKAGRPRAAEGGEFLVETEAADGEDEEQQIQPEIQLEKPPQPRALYAPGRGGHAAALAHASASRNT